ncbi:MAG TPA: cytochrome P450 [Thermoleophilaceae bacterium]|nr:cytochrome P450 [Thermoleophilaceae bacterium]
MASADVLERPAAGRALRPDAEIPGPRLPRLAQTLLAVARPIDMRLTMRDRYGPVYTTNDAIAGRLVHVGERDLVEQIFKWKPDTYNVAEPRELMAPVVGAESLLLLDGARHLRMRKLLLPPFHGDAIAGFRDLIAEVTHREIDRWRPGQTIRMRTVGQAITMEVIIRAVFGITDPDRVAEMKRLLPKLSSVNPLLLLLPESRRPRTPWGRFFRERERVDRMIHEEITRRRGSDEEHTDILALLIAARDEDGAPLTDTEIRDELVTMLLAGHETTATTIAWTFERLLRTPEAMERLAREIREGGGEEYLEAVVKESMRVRPVITEVFRKATRRTVLGGYVIEAGTQVAASVLMVQFDERAYPEPHAFRPERFLGGVPEPYTWIPFGGGVRRCIGAAFALLEMRVVIAAVVARADLRASRPADEGLRFRGVTVLPSRGGEAVVEAIRAHDGPMRKT